MRGIHHKHAVDKTAVTTGQQPAESKTASPGDLTMRVKVHSPFVTYFDGLAHSVTAENDTGQFDILPHHHNFITLLNGGEIDIRAPEGDKRIKISGGVMHVKADKVVVFLDV